MIYQIYEIRDEQEPELAFDDECDTKEECIDKFIGMFDLFDEEDISDEDERLVMKLLDGDYVVESDAVFADVRYIIVHTKSDK